MDDLVDDSDIAEDNDETDNDKSPNCDIMVNVPSLPINLGKFFSKNIQMTIDDPILNRGEKKD